MREGLINVPKFDNDGNELFGILDTAVFALIDRFGGATVTEAFGNWKGPDGKLYREPMSAVTVAYDPQDASGDAYLRNTAIAVGRQTNQLAMYVRYASGDVEIIKTQPDAIPAAA